MSSSSEQPIEKCTLNIRLLDGTPVQAVFRADAKLSVVQRYVQTKAVELKKHLLPFGKAYIEDNGIEFQTLNPKVTFKYEDFPNTTLKDAGLCPRAAISAVLVGIERQMKKGSEADKEDHDLKSKSKLHGDSKKHEFKEKQRMEEELAKKKELEKKKEELERLRLQIEEDKSNRKDIDWVGNALKKKKSTTPTDAPATTTLNNDEDH